MLDNVTGNVGAHIVVGVSASLLCVLLIMGLKLKWFRARMTFDQIPAQEETPYIGVYRNRFASEFDAPRNSFTSIPLVPPPPPPSHPASMPIPNQPSQSSRKPNGVQDTSKDEKPKKTKEGKQKVPKVDEINIKPPKAAKAKAPKLPREVKPEVQDATGVVPKEAKTKQSKVKAPKIPKETSTNITKPSKVKPPKSPKEVSTNISKPSKVKASKSPKEESTNISKPIKVKATKSPKEVSTNISKPSKVKAPKSPKELSTNISKPPNKDKESKGTKNKTKVKDNTERQLSNGAVPYAEKEVASTTNNTFLFTRPKSVPLPRPQEEEEEEEEDGSAMLHYSEEDSFSRGPNRAMKTFSSMMPTKGQVDLSVAPIPQRTPGTYRNPIAAGATSYQSPRVAGSKPASGSVYIDMNAQYGRANQQFIMNLEDESET